MCAAYSSQVDFILRRAKNALVGLKGLRSVGPAPAAELAIGQGDEGEGASSDGVVHGILSVAERRQQRRDAGNGIRNNSGRPAGDRSDIIRDQGIDLPTTNVPDVTWTGV